MFPRLAVISDEVSQEPAVVAAFVREFGLGAVELRSMFGRAFKDLTLRDVAEIATVARGEGWRVCACATPVFKCDLDDSGSRRAHAEIFRRSVEVARNLDCPLLRVFTFLRRPGGGTEEMARRVAGHLLPLCEEAAAAGLTLGVENEASCLVATPSELQRLFAALSHPAARIIWDPCNVIYVPREPGAGAEDLATGFSGLSDRVVHIHVKDARTTAGGPAQAVPVGDGDVGWTAQIRIARERGYRELFSLETHWREKALGEGQLHLPAGYGFSAGGEAASRICLRKLSELYSGAT